MVHQQPQRKLMLKKLFSRGCGDYNLNKLLLLNKQCSVVRKLLLGVPPIFTARC